ncbi:hypothetical protein M434DRAFT_38784 [Hypoxylon sp. CO27-5]|nr:hypothetical protein M434DRAFT_38784 [Hypoxylon sp. CO27-5]
MGNSGSKLFKTSHEKKSKPKTVYTAPRNSPPDQKSGPDKDASTPTHHPSDKTRSKNHPINETRGENFPNAESGGDNHPINETKGENHPTDEVKK